MMRSRPRRILPVIVFSQFAGTSLWFAGNAVFGDLQRRWALAADALGLVRPTANRHDVSPAAIP